MVREPPVYISLKYGKLHCRLYFCWKRRNRVQVLKEPPDNIAFHLPVNISINLHSEVSEDETSNDNMNYLFEKISWKSCTTEHLHSYNQKLVNSGTDLLSKEFSDINNFYEEPAE
jgi:hypothetical protein